MWLDLARGGFLLYDVLPCCLFRYTRLDSEVRTVCALAETDFLSFPFPTLAYTVQTYSWSPLPTTYLELGWPLSILTLVLASFNLILFSAQRADLSLLLPLPPSGDTR